MIPAWLKRFLNTQRNRKLNQRRYPRPPSTKPIVYGKIYGYEYASTIGHLKLNNSHGSTLKSHVWSAKSTDRHYYHDHYDEGCSSCGGMGTTCGEGGYVGGSSSCSGGDSYGDGSDSCGGGEGGCDGGGGGCGGGGCGGGCGGD